MVIEYHNKTIYDCKNVTKRHCTTLWTANDAGEKMSSHNYMDHSSSTGGFVCVCVLCVMCVWPKPSTPPILQGCNFFYYQNTTTITLLHINQYLLIDLLEISREGHGKSCCGTWT
jgi:hypothetical protein